MRITRSFFLPALITAASAASDATVYLFQSSDFPSTSNPPTLSTEQARLVFAQRLGASRYHGLGDASESTIKYINKFGGPQKTLFENAWSDDPPELVLIVDGVSAESAEPLMKAWSSFKPAFSISSPPSMEANVKLGEDLTRQLGGSRLCEEKILEHAIDPSVQDCWFRGYKIIHLDLAKSSNQIDRLMVAQASMLQLVEQGALNALVVLMPASSRLSKTKKAPYGVYEMPTPAHLSPRQAEEPMSDSKATSKVSKTATSATSSSSSIPTSKPITGIPPLCHSSFEACNTETNGCSGHGECYKKRGQKGKDACFTCGCKVQNETFIHGNQNRTGVRLIYWGGSACQKKDVSPQFWLIAGFSVVLMGLVAWAIGMLFSIGEEKLPGVIGAGVSSNRAR